jgi:Spy/CpxP family protein refolding chaperone
MKTTRVLLAALVASGIAVTAAGTATADGMQGDMAPGMMQGGTGSGMMGPCMMQGGMGPA